MRRRLERLVGWLRRNALPVVIVVGLAICATNAVALKKAHDATEKAETSTRTNREAFERADRDTFLSRIAGVRQVCQQFNDLQEIVADLVKVSLSIPPRQGSTLAQREARQAFRRDLGLLEPNDCEGMVAKLTTALTDNDFSKSVPYSPDP